jgi:hypothetical protein
MSPAPPPATVQSRFDFYVFPNDPYVSSYVMSKPVVTASNPFDPAAGTGSFALVGNAANGGNISSTPPALYLDVVYECVAVQAGGGGGRGWRSAAATVAGVGVGVGVGVDVDVGVGVGALCELMRVPLNRHACSPGRRRPGPSSPSPLPYPSLAS